jgi:hypothetical protein
MNGFFRRFRDLTIGLAVLVIVAFLVLFVQRRHHLEGKTNGMIWFYNLKTRQLFPGSAKSVPPLDTESGPATGVRAFVYTCADDADPTNQFIAYLETLTPEAKEKMDALLKRAGEHASLGILLDRAGDGVLVSLPEQEAWCPRDSDEGRQIIQTGRQKGGCSDPRLCRPR